jgi:arginine N-succinyltransferase
MMIIRPITANDTEAFIRIAFEASMGITSMPKNEEILLQKVELSLQSFAKDVKEAGNELYLFVLEDTQTNTIGGTCGIVAKTTMSEPPLYFYRIESMQQHPPFVPTAKEIPFMRIVRYYETPTEICSLYLSPNFRQKGQGRLLSLSRFLFMASFPERFDKMVFAEMRGYIDKNDASPFWEGIAPRHIKCHFKSA